MQELKNLNFEFDKLPTPSPVGNSNSLFSTTLDQATLPEPKTRHFRNLSDPLKLDIDFDPISHSIITLSTETQPKSKTIPAQEMSKARAYGSLEKLKLRSPIDAILYNSKGLCVLARQCHKVFFQGKKGTKLTERAIGPTLTLHNLGGKFSSTHGDFPQFSIDDSGATLLGKHAHVIHYLPDQLHSSEISSKIFTAHISSHK